MNRRDRIMRNVVVDEHGCWIWQRYCYASTGYGRIAVGSRTDGTKRMEWAHRAAYEAFIGPIPEGLSIDHLCRVTSCVNPAHLEAVTIAANIARGGGASARNARKTACPKCGGPYRVKRNGDRECRSCQTASQRARRAQRRLAACL